MCDDLEFKSASFLKSRKYANNLIDILSILEESDTNVDKCILTVEAIFVQVLQRKEIYDSNRADEREPPEAEYRQWLREVYEKMFLRFVVILSNNKSSSQLQVLDTMMKLLSFEGKYPLEDRKCEDYYFPSRRLQQILLGLLSQDINTKHLISKFQEITKCQDVIYYVWKLLPSIVSKIQAPSEIYIKNFLELIDKIVFMKEVDSDVTLCGSEEGPQFVMNADHVCKWMTKTWPCVMKWQYTPKTHKQLLIVLIERILPHLRKPLYLTDYLMDSLAVGGAISVLGLQGMLTLIQTYNLDYPNIYGKLYAMIEPEIFHMKYKQRMFYLTDLFLTSSHLPQQLVAAFIKRLARLTLIAPPPDIHIMVSFIGNLIIRHPGLKKLLVCSPTDSEIDNDPYNMDERDPMKSHAINSFLWEIYNLQTHYLPSIATAATQLVTSPLPAVEFDLGLLLEITEDDIFEKELRKRPKEITLTYEKPLSLKLAQGEKLLQYWSVL